MLGSPIVRNRSGMLSNISVVIVSPSLFIIALSHTYQMGGTAYQFLHLLLCVNVAFLTLGILQLVAYACLMQIGNILADDVVLP